MMYPNRNLNLIDPKYLTWGPRRNSDADWYINPLASLKSVSTLEVNEWFIVIFSKTLESFSHLARAWEIAFQPSPFINSESNIVVLKYRSDSSYEDYINRTLDAMRQYKYPISTISIEIDLFVYVHTEQEQKTPTQGWVRGLADLLIEYDLERERAVLAFSLYRTLFHAFSPEYGNGDNRQLHSLNQPLLYQALRQWEEAVGEITEFDGPMGCYKYGFLSSADAYGVSE